MKTLTIMNGLECPLRCDWADGTTTNAILMPAGAIWNGLPVMADMWRLSDTNGAYVDADVDAISSGVVLVVGRSGGALVLQPSVSPDYAGYFQMGLGFAITIGLTVWVVRLMRKVDVDANISEL